MSNSEFPSLHDMGQISPQDIVKVADENGKDFSRSIKTNQIRNFFSQVLALKQEVKLKGRDVKSAQKAISENHDLSDDDKEKKLSEIQTKANEELVGRFVMLKPKLAYAAGRQPDVTRLYKLVSAAVAGIEKADNKPQAFRNFFELLDSIVAYHKFHGGRDQ